METLIYLHVIRENQRKLKNQDLTRQNSNISPNTNFESEKKLKYFNRLKISKNLQRIKRIAANSIIYINPLR